MKTKRFETFADFYPCYLNEHVNPVNRRFHFAGTSLSIVLLLYALFTLTLWPVLAALVVGYGLAWAGHHFFEKNRPATFRYPLYSLLGDWMMYKDIWLGRVRL